MDKLYNTNKLYLVKLAQVTKIIPSTWHTEGSTYSKNINHEYIAKLIKIKKSGFKEIKIYQLLSKGIKVHNRHDITTEVGELFVNESIAFNYATNNTSKFLSHSTLIEFEKEINEDKSLEQEKTKEK